MTESPVNSKDLDYHLTEFRIAKDGADSRRIVPDIPSHFRRVLEVGCGAAGTLGACGVSEAAFLCGIDADYAALQLGRRLVPRIHFIRAEGERLPFSSEAFDFVIARVSLPYMDIPRALREIARVLTPGGIAWAVLHSRSAVMKDLADSVRRLDLKGSVFRSYVLLNGLSLHLVGRVFSFPFRRGQFESFQTNRSVRNALLAAGLVDVQISRNRFFVATARKPSWILS